jgi:hypothetical protein
LANRNSCTSGNCRFEKGAAFKNRIRVNGYLRNL